MAICRAERSGGGVRVQEEVDQEVGDVKNTDDELVLTRKNE